MEEKQAMQRLFCYYYALYGNVEEAAIKAGFPQKLATAEGLKALNSKSCQSLLKRLQEQNNTNELIETGLKRLAFGNANDAALLVFSDEPLSFEKISQMDLFNVSEIKRIKGGGVEIKLFDRQKALEKLYEYSSSLKNRTDAISLINALKGSCENNG